ncbi:MAG: CBS domain-containing protein [Sphingomonas sp.]|uniref:CBS domain-containing protein n=1 Tax=Sphingomonas sp. TaxID=28214 RepID=UPI001B13D509|nr:CBS domain-containing protein [Sphingomonas sp.]MBO9622300.1 CBS domain-containing protein [Sphingomonas sp.]
MTIAAILGGKGHEVVSIDGDHKVSEAVALLATRRIGAVPVMQSGAVVGVFSERDVIYGLEREGAAALDRQVREVMTSPAITVDPGESVLAALALMTKRRVRHLPVLEGGRCVGIVSIGDLVKYRIERIESEAEAMRAYIQAV